MKIKMIAADLDGTLLHSDKSVSQRTLCTLQKAAEAGCIVLPATGRILKGIPDEILSVPGIQYAIISNGSSVIRLKDHAVIYSNRMSQKDSNKIAKRLCATGYLVEVYWNGSSYAEKDKFERLLPMNPPKWLVDLLLKNQTFVDDLPEFISSHKVQIEKINMPYLPKNLRAQLYQEIQTTNRYTVCSALPTNIEINTIGCSKGTALKALCGKFGIDPSQVMAVGDGGNDLNMLQVAGCAVAMKNGEPDIRSAANFVTGTNDEDGVASAIDRFVLQK